MDADLFWFCPLALFHVKNKGENEVASVEKKVDGVKEEAAKVLIPEKTV